MDNDIARSEKLAAAWLEKASSYDGFSIAMELNDPILDEMEDAISMNPNFGWEVIKAGCRLVCNPVSEDNFVSGPLSSFIFRHVETFSEEIVQLYNSDEKFEKMYSRVIFQDRANIIFKK